jgi:hypothetical protein
MSGLRKNRSWSQIALVFIEFVFYGYEIFILNKFSHERLTFSLNIPRNTSHLVLKIVAFLVTCFTRLCIKYGYSPSLDTPFKRLVFEIFSSELIRS